MSENGDRTHLTQPEWDGIRQEAKKAESAGARAVESVNAQISQNDVVASIATRIELDAHLPPIMFALDPKTWAIVTDTQSIATSPREHQYVRRDQCMTLAELESKELSPSALRLRASSQRAELAEAQAQRLKLLLSLVASPDRLVEELRSLAEAAGVSLEIDYADDE